MSEVVVADPSSVVALLGDRHLLPPAMSGDDDGYAVDLATVELDPDGRPSAMAVRR